jgi:hypothetical protein
MAEQASQTGEAPERVDFDALYRGDFDVLNCSEWAQAAGLELDFLPWDIGEPQPTLRELEQIEQQAGSAVGDAFDWARLVLRPTGQAAITGMGGYCRTAI